MFFSCLLRSFWAEIFLRSPFKTLLTRRTLQERRCLQLPSYNIQYGWTPPPTLQLSGDGAFVNPDHGDGSRAEDASRSAPWNRFTLVSPRGPPEPRLWRRSSCSPGNNPVRVPLWASWMALVPLRSFLEMSSSPLAVSQTALNPSPGERSSSECWGRNVFLKAFGCTPPWKRPRLCRHTDSLGSRVWTWPPYGLQDKSSD